MFETLFAKNPALIIPVLAIGGAAVVFTVWVIAHYWYSIRRQELEAALKQDMLNRGFPTEEIERVLAASAVREEAASEQEAVSDNEYYLIEKMIEAGHATEDIERLVRAFKEGRKPSAMRAPSRVEA